MSGGGGDVYTKTARITVRKICIGLTDSAV